MWVTYHLQSCYINIEEEKEKVMKCNDRCTGV